MTERNRAAQPRAAMAHTRHQRLTTPREAAQGTPTCTDSAGAQRARVIVLSAPPSLDVSEAAFQQLVTDLATVCGWYWWHDEDSRRNQAGLPDLLLLRGTRLIWRELKTQQGRLRPAQVAFGERLTAAGQDWRVWRPGDWADVVATLTGEEERR